MAATAVPPVLPPELSAQLGAQIPGLIQAGKAASQAPTQIGPSSGDMVSQLEQKVNDLEKLAGEVHVLMQQIDPQAGALLVPIAKAGTALKEYVGELKANQAGPTGSSPGMEPTPTPAEKPPVRPMV